MRIATWNVNSIRSRIDRVEAFLVRQDVDVLAVQETKAKQEQFPLMGIETLGYEVVAVGHNQWNGVALISRVGIEDVEIGFEGMPHFNDAPEARAVSAVCGGLRLMSLYVRTVASRTIPTTSTSLKVARLRDAARAWQGTPTALMGDWNVCPFDEDCFDPSQFVKATHLTPPEREAFFAIEADFRDVARPFTPGPGVYTYWDYYRQRFERIRGLRIDFVLGSSPFAERVTGAFDTEERTRRAGRRLDHAPWWSTWRTGSRRASRRCGGPGVWAGSSSGLVRIVTGLRCQAPESRDSTLREDVHPPFAGCLHSRHRNHGTVVPGT